MHLEGGTPRPRDLHRRALFRFCLLNPCFVLAGPALALLAAFCPAARPQLPLRQDRLVAVRGWISAPPQLLSDHLEVELTPLSLRQQGRLLDYPGRLAVRIYSSNPRPAAYFDPPLRYGEVLCLRGQLLDPSHHHLPGVRDARQEAWNRRILHRVLVKSPLLIERRPGPRYRPWLGPLFDYLSAFQQFAFKQFTASQLKFILSVLLGQHKLLEQSDYNQLKDLGIFHLFVVSGFHVSLVALFCHRTLPWPGLRAAVVLVGIWSYVCLTGARLPTLRAGLMISLFYLFFTLGQGRRFLNTLGLTALILGAFLPASLRFAGFQFSLLSLTAIGLFVLPLEPYLTSFRLGIRDPFSQHVPVGRTPVLRLRRRIRYRLEEQLQFWPRRLAAALLVPLSCLLALAAALLLSGWFIQWVTLPLGLYHSNRWIWLQFLNNLIMIPLFSLLVPAAFVLFLTFWLPFGGLAAAPVGWLAELIGQLMRLLPGSNWVSYLRQPDPLEMGIYWLLLGTAWFLPRGRHRVLVVVAPGLLWLCCQIPARHPPDTLAITMLDVGQGESLHLRYPDGTDGLLDTGGLPLARDPQDQFVGERLVSRYLWSQRTRELAYILLTHPDQDHVQGYPFLARAFPVQRLLFHRLNQTRPAPLMAKLQSGDYFDIAGVRHRVLHPPARGGWKSNDASLVVSLRYRSFRMLFTGDIEAAAERALLPALEAHSILKAAHHGSRGSNTPDLIARTAPQLVLVSAGRRNPFGHPAAETLRRFAEKGIPVLSTSQWGSLRIVTDGRRWQIFHYRTREGRFHPLHPGGVGPEAGAAEISSGPG